MDKYILCLANSYKHGGRCLAGIEISLVDNKCTIIRDANGVPKWIRPISHNLAGEISSTHAQEIKVPSILKINGAEYAGTYSHSENMFFQSLTIILSNAKLSHEVLDNCLDNYHSTIFGNRGKALTPECFQNGNYSVMLIKAENPEVYIDNRFNNSKPRMKFTHNGNIYDLPITDPIYLEKIKTNENCIGVLSEVYIVVSLGVEHDGWHSKLIAAIIEPKKEVKPQMTLQSDTSIPKAHVTSNVSENGTSTQQQHTKNQTEASVTSNEFQKTNPIEQKKNYNEKSVNELFKALKDTTLPPEKRTAAYQELSNKTSTYTTPFNISRSNDQHTQSANKPNLQTKSEGCYIATAIYGSYDAPEVLVLRKYRDSVLRKHFIGRIFISTYYTISPYFAKNLKGDTIINKIIKHLLDKIISHITKY